MEDRYRGIRELTFEQVAGVLGIDLAKFKPRKGGTEFSGPCPVHGGKKSNTAFSYSNDGKWHCFSCSAKGRGSIDLAKAVKNIGFQAAVELLEPYATGVSGKSNTGSRQSPELPQSQAHQSETSENPPFRSSYAKYFRPHPWLDARGLSPETLEHFGSGFYLNESRKSSYNDSVMLKIRRWSDGETVGYLSRNIGEVAPEKPKYRFAPGFQKHLEVWGAVELREDHQIPVRVLYVVESAFATMHFYQLGFPCVALMGWSVSPEQLEILAQLTRGIVLLVDRDKQEEVAPYVRLISKKLWVKSPELPTGIDDPERLSKEQILALTQS